jgi:putative serine protease PepD
LFSVSPAKTPKHLWTGDWREEAEALRAGAPAAPAGPPPADAAIAAPPSRRRRSRRTALAGGGAALLAAGAFAVGGLTSGNEASPTSAALPAAASKPITPATGQTRAGSIFAAASPAVVSIRTDKGSGTGFLIDDQGTVVTNAHVVEGTSSVEVHFGENGAAIPGQVVGKDGSSDLAVVRIAADRIPSGTKPLELADSDQVAAGDAVVAIGNPFGLDRTVTEGIVSAVGRDIRAPNGFQISEAIQTDAAINPGNSGGPLLDDGGKVIGVNSQILTGGTSSGNVGVGFAVPSNTVRNVVPILEEGRTVERPWLGVSSADAAAGGARVEQTVPGSPAASSGLRTGDVITGVGDKPVTGSSDLGTLIEGASVGDDITLHVRRGGSDIEISVTLRTRPAEAP